MFSCVIDQTKYIFKNILANGKRLGYLVGYSTDVRILVAPDARQVSEMKYIPNYQNINKLRTWPARAYYLT